MPKCASASKWSMKSTLIQPRTRLRKLHCLILTKAPGETALWVTNRVGAFCGFDPHPGVAWTSVVVFSPHASSICPSQPGITAQLLHLDNSTNRKHLAESWQIRNFATFCGCTAWVTCPGSVGRIAKLIAQRASFFEQRDIGCAAVSRVAARPPAGDWLACSDVWIGGS